MRIVLLTAAATLAFVGTASAQDRYVSFSAGVSGKSDYDYAIPQNKSRVTSDLDSAASISAAYGQKFENFRGEIAMSNRKMDGKTTVSVVYPGFSSTNTGGKSEAGILALDFNGYYDFPVEGKFKPYVGAGIGIANVKLKDVYLDDTTSALHLQAMAGASFEVTEKVAVFAEVRAERVGTITVETREVFSGRKSESDVSFSNVGGQIGIRVSF